MERFELPNGYWVDLTTTDKNLINKDGDIIGNFSDSYHEKQLLPFIRDMNAPQAELAKVQEQLRITLEALDNIEHGRMVSFKEDGYTVETSVASDIARATIEQIKGK